MDPTLPYLGVPYPSAPGGYSLQNEGGVSVPHSLLLAQGCGPDHGGYNHLCS